VDRRVAATATGLIALSTFVITAAIVGLIAIIDGDATGIGGHMPFYVLAAAVVFTALEVTFEFQLEDPIKILSTSAVLGVATLVLVTLASEGVLYAVANPSFVLSRLIVYIVAAGLISTGVIFWAVRHWRELTKGAGGVRRPDTPL
jgi:hypothetical protein